MENNFRIRICSDLNYEGMVVDIIWNNQTVAILNREKGAEAIEIEIFPPAQDLSSWKFPLKQFMDTVFRAKEKLVLLE